MKVFRVVTEFNGETTKAPGKVSTEIVRDEFRYVAYSALNTTTPRDFIDDLRSRINPAYSYTPGTESHERRLCVEMLELQEQEINMMSLHDAARVASLTLQVKKLQEQLAASQAREKVLRDALINHTTKTRLLFRTDQALAQPSDDAALKAALAAERERCIKSCKNTQVLITGHHGVTALNVQTLMIKAIDELGDEK